MTRIKKKTSSREGSVAILWGVGAAFILNPLVGYMIWRDYNLASTIILEALGTFLVSLAIIIHKQR